MKLPKPNDDARLRNAIREWRVDASLPPRFQERVWQRIASNEAKARFSSPWPSLLDAFHSLFARPAYVAACATVFLAAGLSAGWAQAQGRTASIDTSLSTRYVQSVDPYQMPRH